MGNDDFTREPALQGGRRPRRWLRAAGVGVLVLLVGLFVTTLLRTPNPAWTPITAVLALLVASLLARDVRRRHVGR
jgi:hypothetical protein